MVRKVESPIRPFFLERYFARWEFSAPYLLCTSDIEGLPMRDLLAIADNETRELWDHLTLGYTETSGHPLLRTEIARLYDRLESEHILCFAGAEEAIYITLRVLLRPGDHMVVTFPGYQSTYEVAAAIGAKVDRWELQKVHVDGKGAWKADLDDLRKIINQNTRLVLVNFPHNPTGANLSLGEWQELISIVREAGCYLFSDEVYRLLEYKDVDRLPPVADLYEKGISLGVMSKPFGLAGLRIGWLASRDDTLLTQLAGYKDYTTICCSAPSEVLSIMALRSKEKLLERSLDMIKANLSQVTQFMAAHRRFFEWLPPQAGSICFPRWLGSGSIAEFCERLVKTEGVLLLPGDVYEYPGNHFRLGLGRGYIPEALNRLSSYVNRMYVSRS